jgi:hypothetical protein
MAMKAMLIVDLPAVYVRMVEHVLLMASVGITVTASSEAPFHQECVRLHTTVGRMQTKAASTAVARQHCCSTRFAPLVTPATRTTTV